MGIKEAIQQSKFSSEHHKAIVNILFTANWLDTKIKEVLNPFGITHIHFNILRILAGAKERPLSANEIKEVMVFKGSDVTRLIDRLILKGLVERVTCPENRRKVNISISAQGLTLLKKVNKQMDVYFKKQFSNKLTADQAESLSSFLDMLREG